MAPVPIAAPGSPPPNVLMAAPLAAEPRVTPAEMTVVWIMLTIVPAPPTSVTRVTSAGFMVTPTKPTMLI